MTKEDYFYEAFQGMERLGPGSRESTEKALAFFPRKSQPVRILDVGCGVGTHTFLLASHFPKADITAIDSHSPYIQTLNQSAAARGISDRVHGLEMSMFDMTFEKESFDLIWSEGAIYIIGFERGLKEWKRFLKPGGFQICSEISWLKDDPSRESLDFWQSAYPQIGTIAENLRRIEDAGYISEGHFICPVSDWTKEYYAPLQKNLDRIRSLYPDQPDALGAAAMLQSEIDLYLRHKDDYSYVFYAMSRK